MTLHFVVVTPSDEVHRYVGAKKHTLIQKEVRETYSDLLGDSVINAVLIISPNKADKEIHEYFDQYIGDDSSVILAIDNSLSHSLKEFCTSCFVFYFDGSFENKNIQNYFGMLIHKVMRAFDYYAKSFDDEKYRKMCLLPFRNFKATELSDFHNIFKGGIPLKGFQDEFDKFVVAMRKRQKPKTVTTSEENYFIDDADHYFSYGHENHSKPGTKEPPHGGFCRLNSLMRFGKRYVTDGKYRHYNVTNEKGLIGGTFQDCHDAPVKIPAGKKHVNMFPNDDIP
ncbi:hypothetical protein F4V91_06835 [Neorhizobium galegae]|uniref:Uncharacterized protein n=1 Tax=Neorhizobium galegae TaxID=399 RepID=A0A6A1TRC8_NEOGA|nr:hypothetical protein [Neorhizobium galegae]KAB1086174.1 hypothetical protein F4V91_06835 [Neorhizobium galegae]